MAAQFGLPRQAVTAFSGAGRSYFLARLMREVVFGEAGLVGLDPKVERRARFAHYGAYGIAAAVLLALTGLWLASYFGNRAMIAAVHAAASHYETQVAEVQQMRAQSAELGRGAARARHAARHAAAATTSARIRRRSPSPSASTRVPSCGRRRSTPMIAR